LQRGKTFTQTITGLNTHTGEEMEYIELLKWGFLAGICFSWAVAFTSPFLVLQRNALFPHAITHTLFFALLFSALVLKVVSPFLIYPLTLIIVLIFMGGIVLIQKLLRFYEDTSTSLVTHFALALALIIATKYSFYDARLFSYLFGSFVAVSREDFWLSLFTLGITVLFYRRLGILWISQITDQAVPGVNFTLANFFFLVILALQIFVGIKLMGILLVAMFFTAGSSVALKVASSFKKAIILTGLLNVLALFGGGVLSIFWDLPFSAGAAIVMFFFLLIPLVWRPLERRRE